MRTPITVVRARLSSLWRNLYARDDHETALDAEIESYVALLGDRYQRDGMSPSEARRAARIATGGVTQVKETTRGAWAGDRAIALMREVRYALRSLRKSPGFATIAVLTLALGIGGATAIFTVIDAALLHPLPVAANPDRLISVERVRGTGQLDDVSYADYLELKAQARSLDGLAAYNGTPLAITDRAGAGRAWVSYVSDNFFGVLGVGAAVGRVFAADEVGPHVAAPVAVIGYRLWQSRYGGDSSVIGTTLQINDKPFTIVGVAPEGFIGAMRLHQMEVWIPLVLIQETTRAFAEDPLQTRDYGWLRLVGHRRPTASLGDAQRELALISTRLAQTYPADEHRGIRVFAGAGMTDEERTGLARTPRLLAIATAILLLIACANVASLTLVRAAAKRRELATRLALGASRASLVRQLVVEAGVIAVSAAAAGLLIAQALVHSAPIVKSVISMADLDLSIDWRVLAIALVAGVATTALVSIVPAFQISHTDIAILMKDGAGGAVRARPRTQRALVIAQVGASLVMLASAAVLYGAFQRLLGVDPGFDARGLNVASVDRGTADRDTAGSRIFYDALLDRARADPAIDGIALTSVLPPAPWMTPTRVFRAGEEPPRQQLAAPDFSGGTRSYVDGVSNGFFAAMRIPIVLGRDFSSAEMRSSAPVAIISRRLASDLWPNENPLGRHVSWPSIRGPVRRPLVVVGVVDDIRHSSLIAEPSAGLYIARAQQLRLSPMIVYRGRGDAAIARAAVERIVSSLDPRATFPGGGPARQLSDQIDEQLRPQRIVSAWIGVFGMIALFLAAIGVYGIVAQSVAHRTRELAVRSALGATSRGLVTLVLREGMWLGVAGCVTGVAGAFIALQFLRTVFSGVQPADFRASAVAVTLLAVATFLASYIPARRVALLNPVDALRTD